MAEGKLEMASVLVYPYSVTPYYGTRRIDFTVPARSDVDICLVDVITIKDGCGPEKGGFSEV